jgi:hypothetical protein
MHATHTPKPKKHHLSTETQYMHAHIYGALGANARLKSAQFVYWRLPAAPLNYFERACTQAV